MLQGFDHAEIDVVTGTLVNVGDRVAEAIRAIATTSYDRWSGDNGAQSCAGISTCFSSLKEYTTVQLNEYILQVPT